MCMYEVLNRKVMCCFIKNKYADGFQSKSDRQTCAVNLVSQRNFTQMQQLYCEADKKTEKGERIIIISKIHKYFNPNRKVENNES